MKKDRYDKLKIFSEVLRNNWPLLVLAFTALSSLATNASQYTNNEAEQMALHKQIQNIAAHYASTPKEKTIIRKCGNCSKSMRDHLEEFH